MQAHRATAAGEPLSEPVESASGVEAQSDDAIRSRVRELVKRGEQLSQAGAREVAGYDRGLVVPILVEALHVPSAAIRANGAALLCLCPDPSAIDALARLVRDGVDDDLGGEYLNEVAASALARIGLPALPVLERLAREDIECNPSHEALTYLALQHPEVKERVAGVLLDVLRKTRSRYLRSSAAQVLQHIDWLPAATEIGRDLEAGRIDDFVYDPADHEMWAGGTLDGPRTGGLLCFDDPLERFVEGQHDVLTDYRTAFDERVREAMAVVPSAVFLQDAAALCLQPVRTDPRVGRNDPCPCGSGKKHKKCCLDSPESDRLVRLLRRVPMVRWPGSGYAWKLSEQLERMPIEQVERAVDALMSSARELDAMGVDTDSLDDYLLWAVASRYGVLGQSHRLRDIATRIAASDARHPALDYTAIERTAILEDLEDLHGERFREQALGDFLRLGHLTSAWSVAESLAHHDSPEALATYVRIWNTWPAVLWTPLAMAEALLWQCPGELVEHLRRAVELAEKGHSCAHPMMPGRACPVDILQWQLERVKDAHERLQAHRDLVQQPADDPLLRDQRVALALWTRDLRSLDRDLVRDLSHAAARGSLEEVAEAESEARRRHACESARLVQLSSDIVRGVLSTWSGQQGRRWPVFVAERADPGDGRPLLLCVLPVLAGEVTAADLLRPLAAPHPRLAATAALLAKVSREWLDAAMDPVAAAWGDFVALALPAPPDSSTGTMATCFEVLCEEQPVDEATGSAWPDCIDVRILRALVPEADWASLHAGLLRVPAQDASAPNLQDSSPTDGTPEPASLPGLRALLKRVLTRLIRMNKIGAAHTEIGYFWRGVPTSQRGGLKDLLDILVSQRFIRLKPTVATPHISLEPTRLPAIFRFLDDDVTPCQAVEDYLTRAAAS